MHEIANTDGFGPKILVNASAIGFYGDRKDELLTEESTAGSEFLSTIITEWEGAAGLGSSEAAKQTAAKNASAGLRVAALRIGLVLGREAPSFKLLGPIFKYGVGARIGDGEQWMSPVHIDDVARSLEFLLRNPQASGVFNGVCPEPIRNKDFTTTLARTLGSSANLVIPAFALRFLLGDLSHVFLDSERVIPHRLTEAGFSFQFPNAQSILQDVLTS
jgi:uncharacterized protein (TIGR01777 family)